MSSIGKGERPNPIDAELEKLLSREASAFQREVEVDRILKAFKLKYVTTTSKSAITCSSVH